MKTAGLLGRCAISPSNPPHNYTSQDETSFLHGVLRSKPHCSLGWWVLVPHRFTIVMRPHHRPPVVCSTMRIGPVSSVSTQLAA
jgi:hypothetical protein